MLSPLFTAMNIYLISQTVNVDYDTYDSAVVIAPDEDTARNMDPGGRDTGRLFKWEHNNALYSNWAFKPEEVQVRLLASTGDDAVPCVLCASFNAG